MKLRTVLAGLVLATTLDAGQTLDVFVNSGETIPFRIIQNAKAFASRILASADVTLNWHDGMHPGSKSGNRVILMDLAAGAPGDSSRDALGYSLLHDERDSVSIFYDRIRGNYGETLAPIVLAHAMAHEIAHVLEGVSRHSAAGVMKAHWDWRDVYDMKHFRLRFTPEDIRLIQNVKSFPYLSARGIY